MNEYILPLMVKTINFRYILDNKTRTYVHLLSKYLIRHMVVIMDFITHVAFVTLILVFPWPNGALFQSYHYLIY